MGLIKGLTGQQKQKIGDAVELPELMRDFGSWAKKNIPNFNKLKHDDKTYALRRKWLQKNVYEEDKRDVPKTYTDDSIIASAKEAIAKEMGLATKSYESVGKDSSGRRKTVGDQKRMNPSGFSHGGRVHRGRSAANSMDNS